MRVFASIVLATVFVSACANVGKPTPYRAEFDAVWSGYGSQVTDLGDQRFEIYNHASPITPARVPLDHNMLRSAQLAQENGFKYFIVEKREPEGEYYATRPWSRLTISLSNTYGTSNTFSAEQILERLGPKYLSD